jgi:urease alpha subunit
MRTTLSADRCRCHLDHHARQETVTNCELRAEDVVGWATRGGGHALGMDSVIGSVEKGKKADLVLIKNDASPAMFPMLNPYGHVVFQAQRGDVHSVVVNGRLVKHNHVLVGVDLDKARKSVGNTVEYLRTQLGDEAWRAGMNPEIPEKKVLDNPYTYTDWGSDSAQWKR